MRDELVIPRVLRDRWWLICGATASVLCGFVRNVNETLLWGIFGTGIMLIGIIGDTVAPTANKVAFFN